jgi:NADH-quinone oxidoreductase subunit G/NADP-reducing hydrogenase subunit HndD
MEEASELVSSVALMPCTAKKFEAGRPEMSRGGASDIDAVLTTRELQRLLEMFGIDLFDPSLPTEEADAPFGARSGSGKLFGTSGGVMEAALRTAGHLPGVGEPTFQARRLRGMEGWKEARVRLGELEFTVAAVSGLQNARRVLDEIRSGNRKDLLFVEVMTCPGGCIAGGGQPHAFDASLGLAAARQRQQALYEIDRQAPTRASHENPEIQRLYADFLGEPLGALSHALVHTSYTPREASGS